MSSLDPIVLIGMQRSGTSWLGRLFEKHPDIAFWAEPRHVWIYGHWFRPDDRLTAADATPRVVRHIRETFAAFARDKGRPRFAEKTPSNCLRIPFVRAVYPEARIVVIVRDGRSVISSSDVTQTKGVDWPRVWTRARETPLREWPAYLSRAPWLIDKLRRRRIKVWGVRPPGWRDWVDDPPLVLIAKQWAHAVRIAVEDLRADPCPDRTLEIRYEDLTARPRDVMLRVVDFLALARGESLVAEAAASADVTRQGKWKDHLDDTVLAQIRPHMEPTLAWLGYDW